MVAAAIFSVGVSTTPQAKAANLYWDTDTAIAGTGGTGVWTDDKSSNWSVTAAGDTAAGAGTFGAGDVAFFTGTAGTVTLGGPITIGGLVFSGADFTVTGDTLTLAAASGAPTVSVTGGNVATLSSIVAGSNGLTKSGNGVLRLTNASNSYTGVSTISGGALVISSGAALGTDASAISILSANQTPGSTILYGYGGGALVLDGTAAGFTFARNINFEGRGPVGERSAAILSLGNNVLSGTLTSAVSPLSPATFRNTRITSVNGTLTLSGTVISQNTGTYIGLGGVNTTGVGDFNLSGVLSGTGSITKDGAGTLYLNPSATADFSGMIRVGGGSAGQQSSVRVTQASVGGTSVFGANVGTGGSSVIDMNGGVLELRSGVDLDFNALPSGRNVYHRASSTFYAGPAAGGATVNRLVTFGTFRLAANTTATFNSRNGYGMTFQAWTQESDNNPNTITNNMGGTLTFTGNAWDNSDSSARTLNFRGTGTSIITGSIDISGSGIKSLSKKGTGTWEIRGISTDIQGEVAIDNGVLVITDFRSIANNAATIQIGSNETNTNLNATNNHGAGALIIGTSSAATAAGLTTSKIINLQGTTNGATIYANQALASPVIISANLTATGTGAKTLTLGGLNAADNIISGVIPNNSATHTTGLTKQGSGVWVLSALNTYTGATTIQNGTLKLRATAAASDVVGSTGAVVFGADTVTQAAGGNLEFRGFLNNATTETLGALTPTAGAATVTLLGNGTGKADLTFTSLGATTAASSLNFVTTGANGGAITLTGQTATTATTLPGTANFLGRLYVNGADFATINATAQVVAPTYAATGNFQNASTALVSAVHNKLTGSFTNAGLTVSSLLTNSQTLTLTGDLIVTTGGILQSGGTATIRSDGATARTISGPAVGLNLAIRVNQASDVLNFGTASEPVILTVAGTTDGVTKNGAGTLVFFGANTQTGAFNINEGVVRISGASARIGGGPSITIRQGARLELDGNTNNTNSDLIGAGTLTNVNAAATTFQTNGSGVWSGLITQDAGKGALSVIKGGTTGAPTWSGNNTYAGSTTISGSTGSITVDTLADGGVASGIGASSSAAANLVFNSTGSAGLIYRGNIYNGSLVLGSQSASTDRLFTLSGASPLIQSDVTNGNALVWSNSGAIVHGNVAARTLTLGGSSTGDNTFNPQLTDSGTVANITSLAKSGAGQWNLGNSNNTYTGLTSVRDGVLAVNQSGALPANSPVVLGSTTTSGILQASGTFARNLAATAVAGTGTVTWGGTTGGGGFAAHTTSLTVTLDAGAALTWGSGGFVGTGGTQSLFFGSASALADVKFTNPINFGAAKRTINIVDNANTGSDFATLSGVLSGGAGIGFQKTGSAPLRLTGANTYTGVTDINASTLIVTSLGSSTGGATSSVGASGVAMTDANAVTIGNGSTSNALLQHVGPGETSDRKIRINATTGTGAGAQIHADGTGPLILTNVANDMVSNAASKNLWLRGASPYVNQITSQLADFGAALNVIVDGGTSWVLTNGTNSYTGATSVNGGALGIGHNTAISGPLTINNGNVFAHGADRVVTIALNLTANAANGWLGDYGITFDGTNTLAGTGASSLTVSTYNGILSGKSLAFTGMTSAATGNRAWTIDGPGQTVINGNFTTSTLFWVRIDKTGDGTLVLGTSGTGSNWNTVNSSVSAIDLDRGTLRFSVNEAIPSAVGSGGLTISPEVLTADVATVDLSGTTQTVNALTATTDGTVVINNTSTSAATFRFGDNDAAVSFDSATGTYSVQNTGSGALSLVKLGNGSGIFGSGVALANKGEIAVEGGIFTVAGTVSAATALRATGPSALALTGPLSNPQLITSIEVGAGASLGFLNGAASAITGLTSLKLGNTGTGSATLALELGSTTNYDRLSTSAAAITGNGVALNLAGIAGFQAGDYDLITAGSGLSGATFSFGTVSGTLGGFTLALTPSDTRVRLSAAENLAGTYYWSGGVNSSWGGMSAAGSNFTNDLAGVVNANGIPGAASSVVFSTGNQTVTALSITLDGAMSIKDLTFNNQLGTGPTGSISFAPGTSGTLTITPSAGTVGINVQTGAPAAITISAPVTLGVSQTWTVADAATILASSGGIGGTANLTKDGAGMLTLGGTNSYVGTTAITAGVLQAGAANGFNQTSAHTVSAGAILRLNNFDATIGSLAGAGTVENAGTANARTLTVGEDNSSTTFSGTLQDGGAFGLGLTKVGNGMLTLSGANTNTGNFTVNGGRLSVVTGTTTMSAGQFTTASAANTRGMLLIGSGASITTVDLDFGSNATLSAGAGYQTDGTVVLTAADGNTVFGLGNANTAYGYYEISGGSVNMNRLTLSNTGTSGTGVFRQTGGTVTVNTWTLVAHGSGSALLDIAGGVYNSGTNFALGAGGVGAFSFFNVRGSGVFIAATGSTIFANRGDSNARDDMTNVVNLLTGGTIRTASGGITNGTTSGATNNFVHINLNGGTIITNQASTSLINLNNTNSTLTANSGAFVYAGGLTVDTNGLNLSLIHI